MRLPRAVVRALADTMFPAAPDAPPGGEVVPDALEDLAASMDPAAVRELGIALHLLELGALPLHGRRFTRLSPSKRERYLRGWMGSRLGFRRTVYRALRGLVANLYYADERTWAHLGYAGPKAWRERRS